MSEKIHIKPLPPVDHHWPIEARTMEEANQINARRNTRWITMDEFRRLYENREPGQCQD